MKLFARRNDEYKIKRRVERGSLYRDRNQQIRREEKNKVKRQIVEERKEGIGNRGERT